jgi:hypothetical protein
LPLSVTTQHHNGKEIQSERERVSINRNREKERGIEKKKKNELLENIDSAKIWQE